MPMTIPRNSPVDWRVSVYLLHRTMAPIKAMLSAKANPSVFRRVALRKQYRLLTFSGICEKIAALNLETREAFL